MTNNKEEFYVDLTTVIKSQVRVLATSIEEAIYLAKCGDGDLISRTHNVETSNVTKDI